MISDERLNELIESLEELEQDYRARYYGSLAKDIDWAACAIKELLEARRKIALLKEDAERLASAIQHKGSFNEIMAKNFEAVVKHEQVMKEVE